MQIFILLDVPLTTQMHLFYLNIATKLETNSQKIHQALLHKKSLPNAKNANLCVYMNVSMECMACAAL